MNETHGRPERSGLSLAAALLLGAALALGGAIAMLGIYRSLWPSAAPAPAPPREPPSAAAPLVPPPSGRSLANIPSDWVHAPWASDNEMAVYSGPFGAVLTVWRHRTAICVAMPPDVSDYQMDIVADAFLRACLAYGVPLSAFDILPRIEDQTVECGRGWCIGLSIESYAGADLLITCVFTEDQGPPTLPNSAAPLRRAMACAAAAEVGE